MANFFNSVRITNFKSLKDVTLSDCKRINLLIGKPNVGKSNILEAIGLFSLPYLKYNKSKKITQFVRLENLAELFFDGNVEDAISVKANDGSFCNVLYSQEDDVAKFQINLEEQNTTYELYGKLTSVDLKTSEDHTLIVDNKFNLVGAYKKRDYPSPKVRYYKFPHFLISKAQGFIKVFGLIPPSGINFFDIVQKAELKDELSGLFAEYGLNLLLDKTNQTVRVMKALKDNKTMVSFPYSSIADTLQRVIFFKAAIASNSNSILLFEEPEAHCFPPYIAHFTQDVIDAETNQFFIATHSPYVLNDFLEYAETRAQLAIYMADFKDGQTVLYRLTDEELDEVYNYGLDVFFNYERFTEHG